MNRFQPSLVGAVALLAGGMALWLRSAPAPAASPADGEMPGASEFLITMLVVGAPAAGGLTIAVVGDHRHFPVPLPINHDVSTLRLSAAGVAEGEPALEPFQPSAPGAFTATHPEEAKQVAAIRSHRLTAGGRRYQIVRGDLQRHTEISMDGAIDGSLWDLYRYAIDPERSGNWM